MLRYMTLVGALCAAVAPFLSGGAARPDVPDWPVIGLAAGALAVAALGFARTKGGRIAALVGAVVVLGVAVWLLAVDMSHGLTGPRLPVLAVGTLAVAVGAGLSGNWQLRPVGVLAAVLATAAAAVAPGAAQAVIVDSQTRDARPLDPPPIAERPVGGQWSWQPAADVVHVVATRYGVAVGVADGTVVGLDGQDGGEQWRYARRGAKIGTLVASIDRKAIVVTFRSQNTRAQLLVALDADTGVVRFEKVVPSVLVETDEVTPGTRSLVLRDGDELAGYDLVTGDEKWRWTAPESCLHSYTRAVRGKTTVFVGVICRQAMRLVALDEESGRQRWQHQVELAADDGMRQDFYLYGSPDGSVVWARLMTARALPGSVSGGLFDAETGKLLARAPESEWTVRATLGPRVLFEKQDGATPTAIRAVDLATGETRDLDVAACPQRVEDATTSTTYVRACDDNGRELKVVVQGFDGSPATSTSVRLDGSGAMRELKMVVAPGAIVLTRSAYGGTPASVVGLNGPR